jgi:hypothetical protein
MVDLRLPIESQLGPVVAKTPQGPESGPRNNVTEHFCMLFISNTF